MSEVWVPVEDRLPAIGQMVLTVQSVTPYNSHTGWVYDLKTYVGNGPHQWQPPPMLGAEQVDYWRPLPPAPGPLRTPIGEEE